MVSGRSDGVLWLVVISLTARWLLLLLLLLLLLRVTSAENTGGEPRQCISIRRAISQTMMDELLCVNDVKFHRNASTN